MKTLIFCIAGIVFLLLFISNLTRAQENGGQTIKGLVIDAQSLYPLPGVTVVVAGLEPLVGTTTDADGRFKLENVPLGRQTLQFTYVGYEPAVAPNLLVSAGKETSLEIKLEESVTLMEDLVITASEQNKTELTNEMATVSARTFNVEETGRYAGSFNDPSRMAANYAGVGGVNDGRNDIIIRGNSPSGLLWRLEGLDIPNPNHFGALGATGGPVSILNNNLLSDSEFYTGAFPAMYGNATGGVFDLRLRNGNSDKREFLGQIGFNGVELGAEGPFSKASRSSYLINYRYSVPALFSDLGLSPGTGTATPYYQDLSFKLNFPMQKGRLSVFGIGGLSHIDLRGSETSAEEAKEDLYGDLGLDIYNNAYMGVAAASYLHFLDENTFWRNSFSVSRTGFAAKVDTVFRDEAMNVLETRDYLENDYSQMKYAYNSQLNKKFNARNTITAGAVVSLYQMDLLRQNRYDSETVNEINYNGSTTLLQTYLAWRHKFSEKWALNSGLHYQRLFLNKNSGALEPRIGLTYQLRPDQSFSLAYGRHNQMQSLDIYFIETRLPDGSVARTNKELGFTKSDHFVAAYDWQINPNLRLKIEGYYQDIGGSPVEQKPSHFSMLNAGADFGMPDTDSLVNEGTGRNMGVEITFEKFFSDSYYFLFTGSFFDAKYTGSDNIERNTAFNTNYVVNGLFGKEWQVGKKDNSFSIDVKFTSAGNRRYIPLDLEASNEAGYAVYDPGRAFENRHPDYLRADLKLTFRKQNRNTTEEFALDIQNVTNKQNIYRESYNAITGTTGATYQLGIWPMLQYRILF